MHTRPDPTWYLYASDASVPTRLLDDEGRPEPGLTTDAEHALADLAAAVHATAWRLGERELRYLDRSSRCSVGGAEAGARSGCSEPSPQDDGQHRPAPG